MSECPAASVGGLTANSASANVTEHELPEAAYHGDEDAFRHLVEPQRTPLLAYVQQPRPFTILMARDEAGRRWVSGTGYDPRQEPPADFADRHVADVIRPPLIQRAQGHQHWCPCASHPAAVLGAVTARVPSSVTVVAGFMSAGF
jgi:hypothetical protein